MRYLKSIVINSIYLIPFILSNGACTSKSEIATIVLLPDTQYYAEKYPDILMSQVDWILDNKSSIDFVLHQGDLTQNNNKEEWQLVQSAFDKLNNEAPYMLAVGNHDMGSQPGKFADTRNTDMYNHYFPYDKMSEMRGFGGTYSVGNMDNVFYEFEAGNHKWLVMSLEFGPSDDVLKWANQIVEEHPERTVILNTHSYMYSDSTRQNLGDSWRPQAYGIGKDSTKTVNDGEQIWQKFVRKQPNVRFVFSGHILNTGIGSLISINDAGNHVYQFLANYQSEVKGSENGGNGYLRILKLDFKSNQMKVDTYSPYLDQYMDVEGQSFTINNVILE
ncbi:metallophosphoesterase [Marivirga sp.]|uniref:metallophosphoesterase n=1 Tax=Marivirga sp. TaxID=2018662 RepID=UPI003DA6FC52